MIVLKSYLVRTHAGLPVELPEELDYYPIFLAADRCHAKPWEMVEQSHFWTDKALIVQSAENGARAIVERR